MFYFNIKSSSSGNSSLVKFGNNYFLIDLGCSYKYLVEALNHLKIDIKKIKYIFLTHEHVDHTKGLSTFVKENKHVIVFSSKYTALKIILDNFELSKNIRILRKKYKYKLGSMSVLSLETHHDALESFGYIFYYKKFKMCYMTDLGVITDTVKKFVVPCNWIVLESNYDQHMLLQSKYPHLLKTRITSLVGHLSNLQASNFALELAKTGTKYIFLTHLSNSTNTYEKAYFSTYNKVKKYKTKVFVNRNFFQDKIMLEG